MSRLAVHRRLTRRPPRRQSTQPDTPFSDVGAPLDPGRIDLVRDHPAGQQAVSRTPYDSDDPDCHTPAARRHSGIVRCPAYRVVEHRQASLVQGCRAPDAGQLPEAIRAHIRSSWIPSAPRMPVAHRLGAVRSADGIGGDGVAVWPGRVVAALRMAWSAGSGGVSVTAAAAAWLAVSITWSAVSTSPRRSGSGMGMIRLVRTSPAVTQSTPR